jgi:glycosyltransferase involved in cell wall biosynthesis
MYRIGFVLEQALGHVAYSKNLMACLPRDPAVRAHWALVPFGLEGWAASIPVFRSNWTVRAGWRARRGLRQMVREAGRLDALFIHTQVPAVLCGDWVRSLPTVVSLDATPLQYDALGAAYGHASGPDWVESVKWTLNRSCFRSAAHLVTWSDWARGSLIQDYGVPEDRITVIPPGVKLAQWQRRDAAPRDAAPRILFVGADFERKGGPLVVEAFRSIRHTGAQLHVVTRSPVAPQEGVVVHRTMEPNSEALRDLYRACDIFVLPSSGDCLPLALQEAAAAGLALIATPVGAIPEVVREGETGILVPPGDGRALGLALHSLVVDRDRRLSLRAGASAHAARSYDANRNGQRLLELVKRAVADRAQIRPS